MKGCGKLQYLFTCQHKKWHPYAKQLGTHSQKHKIQPVTALATSSLSCRIKTTH